MNADLTDKQIEAMRLAARFMTSKQIARELGISPYAVDQRLLTALRRLGLRNRREAVVAFDQWQELAEFQRSHAIPSLSRSRPAR